MNHWTCPFCLANLDWGERCDCLSTKKEAAPLQRERPKDKNTKVSLSATAAIVKDAERCRHEQ